MKNLAGTWYGELGSRLDLIVHKDGHITGTYMTAVGTAEGVFDVTGWVDTEAIDGNRSFGMVVLWRNPHGNYHSVTSWSGQYRTVDGDELLNVTWLLTKETHLKDDWLSTFVGTDVFTRMRPDAARKTRPQAHPEMS